MALLTESISMRVREQLKAEQIPILQFVSRALAYVTTPRPCNVKLMGVAYALDLPLHQDMPMAAQARRMGVTRASISNAAWVYCRQNGLAPSRWMRSESTTKASRQAREDYCQPINPETETRSTQ
jgi:putative hemolysin